MIAACIAEMSSAIPSAASVYHWASVTGGKYGRATGYFAGWYVAMISIPIHNINLVQVEHFWLDLRHSVHDLYPRKPDHQHVRPVPPRVRL